MLVIDFLEINEEILYTKDSVTKVDRSDIDFLKVKANTNKRKRTRLCVHPGSQDSLHEMLIVHQKGNYIPPHKHPGKSESYHIIEGALQVVIFNDDGSILDILKLDSSITEKCFIYYRLSKSLYHTVIPLSGNVVFHETTNGPFYREDMIFPEWAPTEDESDNTIKVYMKKLIKLIDSYLNEMNCEKKEISF